MPRRRLKTMSDLRRYMAGLINRTEDGKVDPAVLTKLSYSISILSRIIADSDIEERLKQLEEHNEVRSGAKTNNIRVAN